MRPQRHPPFSAPWLCAVLWLYFGLLAGACSGLTSRVESAVQPEKLRFEAEHAAMGTTFRLVLFAESQSEADAAAAAAWRRVDDIERAATDYDRASEARRLGALSGDWTAVSPDLALVLRAADMAWKGSGGAFDPTVGAWSKLWRRALRRREWPKAAAWNEAVQAVGWRRQVRLREGAQGLEARLNRPVRLDFGGVAKGVAVDESLAALAAVGITSALMDGGGDLAALGPPLDADGWRVEVRPFGAAEDGPRLRFVLQRGAVATSGDAYQGGVLSGPAPIALPDGTSSRLGHILDARTLRPLPGPRAAVVTARTAAEADAWATALVVLGDLQAQPALYEGLAAKIAPGLLSGIFFPSMESDPCVGDLFPQDGVRLTYPLQPRSNK